jgi:hypothetical protein
MTLDKARELLNIQISMASGYNRNSAKLILAEIYREYLPHMYGAAAYTVINEVQQLPLKVSDIYRRLTT